MRFSYLSLLSILAVATALPSGDREDTAMAARAETDLAARTDDIAARHSGSDVLNARDDVAKVLAKRILVARGDLESGAAVTPSSNANTIKALQYLLISKGHSIDADGIFGPATKAAVIAFQRSAGLAADGQPGPATLGALVSTFSQGSSGTGVKALQAALNAKGSSLAVDGEFGPGTKAAVVAFQKSKGLDADGIVGPNTWTALFGGGGGSTTGPTGSSSYCRVPNTAGLNLIKEFEGFRANIYTDVTGHATVGYGHMCKQAGCAEVKYPIPLTVATGTQLLADDIPNYTSCMAPKFKSTVKLNANQWAALTSFSFNLGCGALGDIARRINAGEDPNAVATDEIPRYNKGVINGQLVPISGLTRRRAAELALFKTPTTAQGFPNCS